MSDPATIDEAALSAIDSHSDSLIEIARDIWAHPEPGYREHRTAEKVTAFLRGLGVKPRTGVAITGVIARVETGRPGPHLAIMGELDSLIVPEHPEADPMTGAVHVCGHNVQIGNMLAAAAALSAPDVLSAPSGSISFMAVPAEEYIEIEFREGLRESGEIEFLAGKQEFIRLGELDHVDVAMLTHIETAGQGGLRPGTSHNGMIAKNVRFRGRSAHAGGAPHLGVNALNAATLAMQAIHMQRETFQDEDHVRVHPIITRGGAAVSSVPANVTMEMFIRAATVEAMKDAEQKVDRALRSGAGAIGAGVEISTSPGYMPSKFDAGLSEVYDHVVRQLLGDDGVGRVPHRKSSTDMGDVSLIMPALQSYVGGAKGRTHSSEFEITDWTLDVVTAGKALALTAIALLRDGGRVGLEVIDRYEPVLSIPDYLKMLRGFRRVESQPLAGT